MIIIHIAAEIHPPPWEIALKSKEIATITSVKHRFIFVFCFRQSSMDKRQTRNFDIDNIVIPYSVAASTRPELLPYKEIPTPK